jgi:hypothetical protein
VLQAAAASNAYKLTGEAEDIERGKPQQEKKKKKPVARVPAPVNISVKTAEISAIRVS